MHELTRDGEPIAIGYYPDGMPHIKNSPLGRTLVARPSSLSAFVATLAYCDAERERGHGVHTLVLPFVPGARQDRMMIDGDELFTLKYVAKMLNLCGFERVIVLDPHSDVTPALIDRCTAVPASFAFELYGAVRYDGMIAPDAGAAKRAAKVAGTLGLPLYQAGKTRDVSTGNISGFWCEPLPSGRYLIVDDICDAGGTFNGLADMLRAREDDTTLELDLFETHGLFTAGTAALLERFAAIITTDSTLTPKPGVQIIDVTAALENC